MIKRTRKGRHGTLFLYEIRYRSGIESLADVESPEFKQRVWAYSQEHAEQSFYDTASDDGWYIDSVKLVTK